MSYFDHRFQTSLANCMKTADTDFARNIVTNGSFYKVSTAWDGSQLQISRIISDTIIYTKG